MQYGYEHERMDATSPALHRGNYLFPRLTPSVEVTQVVQTALPEHYQGYRYELIVHDLIPQLRERREGGRGGERGRRNWGGMERKMEDDDGWRGGQRDGWMDDGGKVDLGITLCSIRMNMNGSMLSHSPQGQIPFPSSYTALRRGHTSILEVALHQHHQGH